MRRNKFKLSYKLLVNILLLPFIAFSFATISNIYASSLADQNDIFQVTSPGPNTIVKGITYVKLKIYDNDKSSINFSIKLYDVHTCSSTFYGNINQNSSIQSNAVNDQFISWNTTKTQSNSSIEDGNYCLKVCAAFYNGSAPYTACNSRSIRIVNHNTAPTINTNPSTLQFKEGETFNYQVGATDSDGDSLTYRIISNPGFLTIDPLTGNISSSALSANENSTVTYNATIGVEDGINPTVTQSFTFTVNKVETTEPTPTEPEVPEEEETPEPEKEIIKVNFTSPKEGDVINAKSKLISWNVSSGADQIKSYKLEYSSDLTEWFNVNDNINADKNYYIWDIANLLDNSYYLRLTAVTEDEQNTQQTSGKFIIKTFDDSENLESSPLIIDSKPENNSDVKNNTKPQISGNFVASEGAEIVPDTFAITLDGNDFKAKCIYDQVGFLCTPTTDLNLGSHTVKISINDTSNQKAESEWSFNIKEEDTVATTEESGSGSINTLFIILIIVVIAILVLIPWIIYTIWVRGKKDKFTSKETIIENKPSAGEVFMSEVPKSQPIEVYKPEPKIEVIEPVKPVIVENTVPIIETPLPEGKVEDEPDYATYVKSYPDLEPTPADLELKKEVANGKSEAELPQLPLDTNPIIETPSVEKKGDDEQVEVPTPEPIQQETDANQEPANPEEVIEEPFEEPLQPLEPEQKDNVVDQPKTDTEAPTIEPANTTDFVEPEELD